MQLVSPIATAQGYFMADIIVYLLPHLSSNDPLFILHHFTTSGCATALPAATLCALPWMM